jgi:hypothetical protein
LSAFKFPQTVTKASRHLPPRRYTAGEQRTPTQSFNYPAEIRIALHGRRAESVAALNQILADTTSLRDLYKKHHWQTSGATFYQLH